MPEQLLLPGIAPPPPPEPRRRGAAKKPRERLARSLFFAIFPPPEVAAAIASMGARLDAQHALKTRLTPAHRLHVTLHHLGDFSAVPRKQLQAAFDAAARIAPPPSFDIAFDAAARFDRSRALVLCADDASGTSALAAFRQRLGEALADAGFTPEREYTPHLTLGFTPRKVARQPVAPTVRFTADAFALLESHVGEGVYEERGRWPAA